MNTVSLGMILTLCAMWVSSPGNATPQASGSTSMLLCKIASQDQAFLDFYGPLAHHLQGKGTVYTPYPVIAPNARMAVPPPTHVLVGLDSEEAFAAFYPVIRNYLAQDEARTLMLHTPAGEIAVSKANLPEERVLIQQLFPQLGN